MLKTALARVEVNVGPDKDITISRRVKDEKIGNVVARQYKRRLDDQFVLYYDLIDYDETFFYDEELVSGKPVPAKIEPRPKPMLESIKTSLFSKGLMPDAIARYYPS